ncbi:hypothetical protein LC55x_0938 [Lysobacter capsici]|nr:hypothetical protein LC55x_0938 [Lysobacter capsici]
MHLCFPLLAHPARAASRSKHAAPGADPAASLPNRMPRPCAIRLPRLKKEDTISYRRNISIQDGAVLIDPARPAAAAQASPKARPMPAPSIRAQAEAQATVRDGFFRNY